jgi:hypothetical protein
LGNIAESVDYVSLDYLQIDIRDEVEMEEYGTTSLLIGMKSAQKRMMKRKTENRRGGFF